MGGTLSIDRGPRQMIQEGLALRGTNCTIVAVGNISASGGCIFDEVR